MYGEERHDRCSREVPLSFAAVPSGICATHLPQFLVPTFSDLLLTENAAYRFECSNSEYAEEFLYLDSDQCGAQPSLHSDVPLDRCEEREMAMKTKSSGEEGASPGFVHISLNVPVNWLFSSVRCFVL